MAQHIVKLSTASLSNAEDRLLVEKRCSFLRFLLSQMQILLSMERKTRWLNPVSYGMLGPKISQWSLAGREAGRPSTSCGKKPSKGEYFEPGLPLYFTEGSGYFLFGFAVQGRQMPSVQHCQQTLLGLWSVSKPKSSSVRRKTLQSDSSAVLKVAAKQSRV